MTKRTKWPVWPAKTQISLGAQSDQSLRYPHKETLGPQIPIERKAKTDQTGWMPRWIWIFAGRTGHFVGFVMLRLICEFELYTGRHWHLPQWKNIFNCENLCTKPCGLWDLFSLPIFFSVSFHIYACSFSLYFKTATTTCCSFVIIITAFQRVKGGLIRQNVLSNFDEGFWGGG